MGNGSHSTAQEPHPHPRPNWLTRIHYEKSYPLLTSRNDVHPGPRHAIANGLAITLQINGETLCNSLAAEQASDAGCLLVDSLQAMGRQFHLDADTYLDMMRREVEAYDELQTLLADATKGLATRSILDLGSGTGETAIATLKRHPQAHLVGIDSSEDMLSIARHQLPGATFIASHLQDPLPDGPFDVVISACAVHHLDGQEKASLFRRIRHVMSPGGCFVMLDVVTPTGPVERPIPLEQGVDMPSSVQEMLGWLEEAGFDSDVLHAHDDLAILKATAPL